MRLTNATRDNISVKEVSKKFDKQLEKIKTEFQTELLLLAKAKIENIKFPSHLFDDGYLLRSAQTEITFSEEFKKEHMVNRYSTTVREYDLDEPLIVKPHEGLHKIKANKKLETLYLKRKNLEEERRKFSTDLRDILYCYNTDKQLVEAIPECSIYFEDEKAVKTSTALVPIDQIKSIRKQLVRP